MKKKDVGKYLGGHFTFRPYRRDCLPRSIKSWSEACGGDLFQFRGHPVRRLSPHRSWVISQRLVVEQGLESGFLIPSPVFLLPSVVLKVKVQLSHLESVWKHSCSACPEPLTQQVWTGAEKLHCWPAPPGWCWSCGLRGHTLTPLAIQDVTFDLLGEWVSSMGLYQCKLFPATPKIGWFKFVLQIAAHQNHND